MRCRFPGSNDPNTFIIITIRISMNNQQDDYGFDHPDRMPSLLTVFEPVRHDQKKRVIEDSLGEIECDAVLSKIAPSLLRIPFEPAI